MTMTLSPQSTCGVNDGLCLPRRMLAMIDATRPTTRPSASISTHFFSTVAAFADTVVLVSAFMARSLTDMDRSMSAPKQGRRLSRRDEAALRSGPMAPDKKKVKLCAALLTGIMVPLISIRGFQRAHRPIQPPAAPPVGRDQSPP